MIEFLVIVLVATIDCFDLHTQTTSGYVNIRPNAHTFYWLYYAAHFTGSDYEPIEQPETKPLVLWLQGGPGASSTGFGNFELIGPLDTNLGIRNSSWINYVNLLFVDNPVGTGFSYVDDESAYATDNAMIGQDLTDFLIVFMNKFPKYQVGLIISIFDKMFIFFQIYRIHLFTFSPSLMAARWRLVLPKCLSKRLQCKRFDATSKVLCSETHGSHQRIRSPRGLIIFNHL